MVVVVEVLVMLVVVCSNDGLLEIWGCYAMIFGEILVTDRRIDGPTTLI